MAFSRQAIILALVLSPTSVLAAPAVVSYPFEFKLGPGDSGALKADADLSGRFRQVETGVSFAIEAGPSAVVADPLAPAAPGLLSRESVGLSAAWSPIERTRIDLAVSDHLGQTWNPLSPLVAAARRITTDDRTVSAGVSLQPLPAVDLSLVGATTQNAVMDARIDEPVEPRAPAQLTTATQSATAGLRWRPISWFDLDLKGRLETTNAQWRGPSAAGVAGLAAANLDSADFQPSITGAVTTPGSGRLNLTFEHAVAPLNAQAFETYAAAEDRAAGVRFGPDREWRYRLQFNQKLAGDLQLDAGLTEARIENATELGPVGGGLQAPISVTGGGRQQLDLVLSAPLAALGLSSMTLHGAGAWRSSQVRDPFTGSLREASAEAPMTASLGVVQTLADWRARWGIEGRFGGGLSLYQMSKVTQVAVADSVGGFIEYVPGPFALRLQVDGLYGGDHSYTDFLYSAPRGSGFLERVDHRSDGGEAVRLVLRKGL